ncbi:hypothetical protein, partial [Faecalibaculum rodentium]|uniref:hypothetical protein n=1 Tax=Faecalibaculum rodentium TaxID=1702221 RepID=UPI00256F4BE0
LALFMRDKPLTELGSLSSIKKQSHEDCVRSPHGINVYRALTSSGKINITGAGTAPSKFH